MSARSRKSRQTDIDSKDSSKKVNLGESSRVPGTSGFVSGSIQTSRIRERSASPLNISRTDEKEELSHLNDRLAQYIDYVRKLEKDKELLKRKINTFSEERVSRVNDARSTYEDEITSLRRLVDDLANQKAAADIELKKHKDDSADAKAKLTKRDLELRNLQRKIDNLERDLSSYKQGYDLYYKMKPDYEELSKRNAALRSDLDAETILRTDLENKVAGLREELDFKNRLFDEEREKLISRTLMIEEEIEDRKHGELESRLADELQSYRQQTANELEEYRTEMENSFQTKLGQLRLANSDTSKESEKLRDEILIFRKRSDELALELAKKSTEVDLLTRRVSDLENLLDHQRDDYEIQLRAQRDEVRRLQLELEQRFGEFTDLMNTKIALDQEILMYRKMLEGEESRLNISTTPRDSAFGISSPKKRRLGVDTDEVDDDNSSSEYPGSFSSIGNTRYSFRVSTSSTGKVEFSSEQDGQGRWVKLVNSSDKDVSLGNWVLKHQADGNGCSFKLHRSVNLKPASTCTIWSSDTDATHNPPKDIVMKNQSFSSGADIKINLMDPDGQEQASCSVVRERIRLTNARTHYKRSGNTTASDDKCSLM